jgi:hypothetical protein
MGCLASSKQRLPTPVVPDNGAVVRENAHAPVYPGDREDLGA